MSRKTSKLIHWGFDKWCDSSPCGANLPTDTVAVRASKVTCPKCQDYIDQEIRRLGYEPGERVTT